MERDEWVAQQTERLHAVAIKRNYPALAEAAKNQCIDGIVDAILATGNPSSIIHDFWSNNYDVQRLSCDALRHYKDVGMEREFLRTLVAGVKSQGSSERSAEQRFAYGVTQLASPDVLRTVALYKDTPFLQDILYTLSPAFNSFTPLYEIPDKFQKKLAYLQDTVVLQAVHDVSSLSLNKSIAETLIYRDWHPESWTPEIVGRTSWLLQDECRKTFALYGDSYVSRVLVGFFGKKAFEKETTSAEIATIARSFRVAAVQHALQGYNTVDTSNPNTVWNVSSTVQLLFDTVTMHHAASLVAVATYVAKKTKGAGALSTISKNICDPAAVAATLALFKTYEGSPALSSLACAINGYAQFAEARCYISGERKNPATTLIAAAAYLQQPEVKVFMERWGLYSGAFVSQMTSAALRSKGGAFIRQFYNHDIQRTLALYENRVGREELGVRFASYIAETTRVHPKGFVVWYARTLQSCAALAALDCYDDFHTLPHSKANPIICSFLSAAYRGRETLDAVARTLQEPAVVEAFHSLIALEHGQNDIWGLKEVVSLGNPDVAARAAAVLSHYGERGSFGWHFVETSWAVDRKEKSIDSIDNLTACYGQRAVEKTIRAYENHSLQGKVTSILGNTGRATENPAVVRRTANLLYRSKDTAAVTAMVMDLHDAGYDAVFQKQPTLLLEKIRMYEARVPRSLLERTYDSFCDAIAAK